MQIHELTQRQLDEGLLDLGKKAAGSVANFGKQVASDVAGVAQGAKDISKDRATARQEKTMDKLAAKAAETWNSYVKQLEKSREDAPPVAISVPAAPQAAAPVTPTVKSGHLTMTKGADGKWKDNSGREIVVPKDVAELEKRWKQQQLLQAQNKQMSPASGIKEAGPGIAARAQQRNAPTASSQPAAQSAGATAPAAGKKTISALDAFRQRKDKVYLNALKQFVQKNLLSGQPYNRLQNADVIDNLIATMARPDMADPAKQLPYWRKLVQQAAVADVLPQGASASVAPADSGTTGKESPEELKEPVVQTEKSDAGVDPATLAKVGAVLRKKFTGNNDDIGSTGDPAVDALLMAMGFRP